MSLGQWFFTQWTGTEKSGGEAGGRRNCERVLGGPEGLDETTEVLNPCYPLLIVGPFIASSGYIRCVVIHIYVMSTLASPVRLPNAFSKCHKLFLNPNIERYGIGCYI